MECLGCFLGGFFGDLFEGRVSVLMGADGRDVVVERWEGACGGDMQSVIPSVVPLRRGRLDPCAHE